MAARAQERRRPRSARGAALGAALALLLALPSAASAELRFAAPDGSPISFEGKAHTWCGRWGPYEPVRSVHLLFGGSLAHWETHGVLRDLRKHPRVRFPGDLIFNRPHGAYLFVATAEGPLENSSSTEDSSGSITFTRLNCQPGGLVEFTVHAKLGSEISGGLVSVSGTHRSRSERPPGTR